MEKSIGSLREAKETCPDEAVLARYIAGAMAPREKDRLEEHASSCAACLENIRAAHAAESMLAGGGLADTPVKLKEKAKGLAKMDTGKKRMQSYIWLAATVIAFTLSFTAPKYFAQFLVAALILGLKWVSESEGIRTLIISMDAKHRHEHEKEALSRWKR
jgi:hypothetical protein